MTPTRRRGEDPHEFLARVLKAHGLSGRRAADLSGCGATAIRAWVAGERRPRGSNLLALARVIGSDGPAVLGAFGYGDLAGGLAGELEGGPVVGGDWNLTYEAGRPLTIAESAALRAVIKLMTTTRR